MKYAIICSKRGRLNWIPAISDSIGEAKKYQSQINKAFKSKIVKIQADHYPIFIIEDKNKFEFTTDDRVLFQKVRAIKKIRNFDDCYFTYYTIDKQFFTKPIGLDLMGIMEHCHVDNEYL